MKKFELGYGYAPNGNLTGKSVYDADTGALTDAWNYAYDNHAVTNITTTSAGARFAMVYDAAGNMIIQSDATRNLAKQMAYDSYNRIRQVTDQGTGTVKGTYWYDDQGFRVRREAVMQVDGEEHSVQLLYPSMYFSVETQKDQNGVPVEGTGFGVNNVYLNGVRVAAVLPNCDAQYYLTDQVDSVKVVTNDAGLVVTSHEYLPFGEDWITEGDEKNAPKYNSQELDKESGYYFYNARHYDPEIARFVTADTVIDGQLDTQGWNRYMYCRGNPIRYNDPTGHDWRDNVLSKAQSVGEGIRNVGEKITQPLRDAGNALRDKLNGNLQNKANGSGNRIQLSGDKIRDEMIKNYKEHSWTDKTGKTTTWSDTTIGGVKVNMNNVSKQDIGNTSNKTLETLNNMIKGNNLSEMTIERLYRGGKGQGPHGEGLGADITQVKSGKDVANFNKESGQSETKLAEKVTKWAMDNNKNISQVLTPWHMNYDTSSSSKGVSNKWNPGSSDTSSQDYQHRNHLHMTIK